LVPKAGEGAKAEVVEATTAANKAAKMDVRRTMVLLVEF